MSDKPETPEDLTAIKASGFLYQEAIKFGNDTVELLVNRLIEWQKARDKFNDPKKLTVGDVFQIYPLGDRDDLGGVFGTVSGFTTLPGANETPELEAVTAIITAPGDKPELPPIFYKVTVATEVAAKIGAALFLPTEQAAEVNEMNKLFGLPPDYD